MVHHPRKDQHAVSERILVAIHGHAGLYALLLVCTLCQVAMHSSPTDCWVSFLGGVYDVTKLIKVW